MCAGSRVDVTRTFMLAGRKILVLDGEKQNRSKIVGRGVRLKQIISETVERPMERSSLSRFVTYLRETASTYSASIKAAKAALNFCGCS
jgi:hypothetical protein